MPYRKEQYDRDPDWDLVTNEETGEQRWVDKDGNQYEPDTGITGIPNNGLGSQFDEDDEWDLDEDEDED